MTIVILEDDEDFAKHLRERIQQWAKSTGHFVEVVMYSGTEALQRYLEVTPGVGAIFFDIMLGDVAQGFDVARELYARGSDIPIVFVTSSPDYVYEGYEIEALRYIRKPVSERELVDCLDAIARKLAMRDSGTLVVKTRSDEFHFAFRDIYYIESRRNRCELHLADTVHDIPQTLTHTQTQLSAKFVRIHRSFVVNIDRAVRMTSKETELENGRCLPIGRKYREEAHLAFQRSVMK